MHDVDSTHPTVNDKCPRLSEIGVVTIVLATLTTVFAPFVVNATDQERSDQITCASHVKELGLGLLQYTQDFDEEMPPPIKGAPQAWAGRLYPYIAQEATYKCPTDKTAEIDTVFPPAVPVSYGLNSNFKSEALGPNGREMPMKLAAFVSPASTVAFFEVSGVSSQISLWDEGTNALRQPAAVGCVSTAGNGLGSGPDWGCLGSVYTPQRHMGGSNIGAIDGHMKWYKPQDVSSGTTNPDPNGFKNAPDGVAAGTGVVGDSGITFSTN